MKEGAHDVCILEVRYYFYLKKKAGKEKNERVGTGRGKKD